MIRRLGMGENPQDGTSQGAPQRNEVSPREEAAQPIDAPTRAVNDVSNLPPAGTSRAAGAMDSMTGATIGHYLVGERLGGGAMAAVYRAHDQSIDQDVAIKVVLPGADAVMQARFRREARLVSTLIHPHIVRTLQVGRSGGVVYIAMELVEGTTLAELLERHGKLSVADAARILAPIAEALAHAHAKGIVHRDVKPSNILLQRAARNTAHSVKIGLLPYPVVPLLSDFGIARALDAPELTNAGRTIGTPAFMAPEQCAGSADIDGRADVYALGAVLYRCLVGRAPYSGSTTQILHAHVYDPLLIPDEVADALPGPVMRVLARAMMKDPAQRFANIGLMAAELQQVATLPMVEAGATGGLVVDSTMTMASLPTAKAPTTSTSRVLVPAAGSGLSAPAVRPGPVKPVLRPSIPLSTPIRSAPAVNARKRSPRNRWVMGALVAVPAVLVVLLAAMLINSAWPGVGDDDPAVVAPTATSAAVAEAGTPQVPTVEAAGTPAGPAAAATRDSAATGTPARPTNEPTPDGPTRTPQPPLLSLLPTWELALAAYDEGDWQQAVSDLTLVQRTLDGWDLPGEEEIDPQQMVEMLVTSYIGLATNAAREGMWARAVENMEKAAALAPDVALLADMVTNVQSLADLLEENGAAAEKQLAELRTEFADLQAAYAARLVRQEQVCDASIHIEYAIGLADSEVLQEQLAELTTQCRDESAVAAVIEVGGTILYSSVAGDRDNIYRMPIVEGVGTALPSVQVLAEAAQPSLSPNGNVLAYYSDQEGNDGLSGVSVSGLTPYGGSQRFSPSPEDSRESPPSWNSTGTSLAYSTRFSDQPPHIWITSADANTSARDMGIGKDPAWRPNSDVIVFTGPDNGGQNEGLYYVTTANEGRDRTQLTDNGNDQRAVWTSDGKYLVFMSRDRGNSNSLWEIYRMDLVSGQIVQLTDGDPAQDGLPTISPDNKWVAFMSDRGGRWNLYYVSIDGGEVHFLSSISGQPLSWLEHAIQWVP